MLQVSDRSGNRSPDGQVPCALSQASDAEIGTGRQAAAVASLPHGIYMRPAGIVKMAGGRVTAQSRVGAGGKRSDLSKLQRRAVEAMLLTDLSPDVGAIQKCKHYPGLQLRGECATFGHNCLLSCDDTVETRHLSSSKGTVRDAFGNSCGARGPAAIGYLMSA